MAVFLLPELPGADVISCGHPPTCRRLLSSRMMPPWWKVGGKGPTLPAVLATFSYSPTSLGSRVIELRNSLAPPGHRLHLYSRPIYWVQASHSHEARDGRLPHPTNCTRAMGHRSAAPGDVCSSEQEKLQQTHQTRSSR